MVGTCSTCNAPTIYWSPQRSWLHRNPLLDTHNVKHGVLVDPLLIKKLYDARAAAAAIEEAKPIEVFEPEVRAHVSGCWPWRVPGGCVQVGKAASNNGWVTHSLHYSRGPLHHGTSGDFLRMTERVVLRVDKDYRRVVGVWEEGGFSTAYALNPLKQLSAKELKAHVTDTTDNLED